MTGRTASKAISADLAEYVCSDVNIPENILQHAREVVADTIGVTIFGSTMPWSQAIRRVAASLGGASQATICPEGSKTSVPFAAFVNGSYAHANDYDEYYAFGPLHPGAGVWAVLPVAEWCGATGEEALHAIVLYYDVCTRLAEACFRAPAAERSLASRGFQAQALCGVFAAAASTCKLLRMTVPQIVSALGIAGSYPGGLLEFLSDASDTKRFHFGKASAQGILAALLAREGLSGPSTVLEGGHGFFNAYSGSYSPDEVLRDLGSRFDIASSVKKPWPVMGGNTTAIESLIDMMGRNALTATDVVAVTVDVRTHFLPYSGPGAAGESRSRPRNRFEAEMSLPFQLALAAVRGGLTLDDFDDASLTDPALLDFASKVVVKGSAEIDAVSREDAFTAIRVTVETTGGRTLVERNDWPRGDPRRPMSEPDLRSKFTDCTTRSMPMTQSAQLWEACMSMAGKASITQLMNLATLPRQAGHG